METDISYEQLKILYEHSKQIGTEAAFLNLIMIWSEQANQKLTTLSDLLMMAYNIIEVKMHSIAIDDESLDLLTQIKKELKLK
jgi:hypothetical protein